MELKAQDERSAKEGTVFWRFSGLGPGIPNWIVVDIVRVENGVLAEHWDVIEDEATRASSKSGLPMFGDRFTA